MLLIVSIIITAELYSTFKYHMKIGETTRCCSFFLKTHVKISSKISIIEFNIQIKWCIIVTPSREAEKDYQGYFNSPPHKKNHIATTMINTVFFKISTHILTKRMTIIHSFAAPAIYISTHILTKRMTDGFPTFCILCVISTHILTKRMTTLQQLVRLSERYFNSHPHEEDDWKENGYKYGTHYFNSHPHEEDDCHTHFCMAETRNFNSHPHEEDDHEFVFIHCFCPIISTHILTKRMTQ